MNMMNKYAKFHLHSPSDKNVKFNLLSAIELSETAAADFCAQLFIETFCKQAISVSHLTNFSFEFFYEGFTEDAVQQKVKNDQKLKSRPRGSVLSFLFVHYYFNREAQHT